MSGTHNKAGTDLTQWELINFFIFQQGSELFPWHEIMSFDILRSFPFSMEIIDFQLFKDKEDTVLAIDNWLN